MRRIKSPTSKSLLLSLLLIMVFMGNRSHAIEKPEYEVLHEVGKVEYRLYETYIVAETEVVGEDSYNRASNEGFQRLFRYISGANRGESEIAMTAPVQRSRTGGTEIAMTAPVQRSESEQGWTVAFMLPSQYSMETAPVPSDDKVSLRQLPQRLMAVIRYSGRWTERNLEKYEARLLEQIAADGVEIIGPPESAAYNAPFTPPFLRRNEIMIEVASAPGENTPSRTAGR